MIDCLNCKNFKGCIETVKIDNPNPNECSKFKDINEDRKSCDEITIPSNFTHDQLIIECDKIILRENGQEVEFEFENNKINNINVIVINGIKFERIKKYE